MHSQLKLYFLAAVYNPDFVGVFAHIRCVQMDMVSDFYGCWSPVGVCLYMYSTGLCAQRAEKKKKTKPNKKQASHKSCARKSNPTALTNAWWRCHWNLDKVCIGPAVRSSYCAETYMEWWGWRGITDAVLSLRNTAMWKHMLYRIPSVINLQYIQPNSL